MEETRTEKISVNLTPSALARLDSYAKSNLWPRSTAAAVLIELGLDFQDKIAERSGKASRKPDIAALVAEFTTDHDQEDA